MANSASSYDVDKHHHCVIDLLISLYMQRTTIRSCPSAFEGYTNLDLTGFGRLCVRTLLHSVNGSQFRSSAPAPVDVC